MTRNEIEETAAKFGINIQTAINLRVRYLEDLIDSHQRKIDILGGGSTNNVSDEFIYQLKSSMEKEIRAARYELKAIKRTGEPEAGEITREMIARAKSVPIESLIDFDRNGSAVAWCHPDKSPSLKLNRARNTAKCFVCNEKPFDTIDTLMKRDGLTWPDAVRSLCECRH